MFDKIKEKVTEFLWSNSSHDLDHTMRVHDMCVYIWEQEWAYCMISEDQNNLKQKEKYAMQNIDLYWQKKFWKIYD